MSDEMIERVTRALHTEMLAIEHDCGGEGSPYDEMSEEQLSMLQRLARAAIEATTVKGEIDRLREEIVELWHKTDQTETRELHEVLGMTFEQYGAWLTASQALGSTDNVG